MQMYITTARKVSLLYIFHLGFHIFTRIDGFQGWCGILIFDKYTYLASFWYLSLYKYPKYTYVHPKYTYYQNILMRRVNMRKCPKGGPLKKYFFNFSNLDCHAWQLKCKWRVIECCLKANNSSNEPPTFLVVPLAK